MFGLILFIFLSIVFYIITQKLSVFNIPTKNDYRKRFIEMTTYNIEVRKKNNEEKINEIKKTSDTSINIQEEDEVNYDEWTPLSIK